MQGVISQKGIFFIVTAVKKKVKLSLLQAMEAHRVARGYGSHIT
jgi:hypothetical protein